MSIKNCSRYSLLIVWLWCAACQQPALFKQLSPATTHIHFENTPQKHPLFSLLYYLYYYNGGGVSIGDINNDGLPDIYFTANSKGNNKLYLNKGNFEFEDITLKAGVAGTADWCTGATMADVNGDGLLDIYVSVISNHYGLKGHNMLYINNGNNTFSECAEKYGLNFAGYTTQACFFDYDHDGDVDCYILNQSHQPNQNIVDTLNRRKYDPFAGDRFYRNDIKSSGKFTDVSSQAGIYQSSLGYGLGISVADINNDGWEDIYIGNDFHENDYYYVNQHNGTFKEEGAKHFGHYSRFSMGNDVADYNNDGQLDIVTVDMLPGNEKTLKTYGSDENADIYKFKIINNGYQYQYSKNCLQRNNGNGESFSETSLLSGIAATDWSWCPLFADFDNDGNKDLFISSGIVKRPVDLDYIRFVSNIYTHKALDASDKLDNVALEKMPDGASHPFLYQGDGHLHFSDRSTAWGTGDMKGYYNGAAYADLDNDGRLDLVINCINAPAVILKNNTPAKNYLSVAFKGTDGNSFGIGAKAYVFTKGKMQYQQLMLTRGFQSSSDTRLHFGIDTTANIDSILIIWPNQNFQVLKNVKPNTQLIVRQNNATGSFDYNSFFPTKRSPFTDITNDIRVKWKHRENDFSDFNIQYLIPHAESTRGPKIAVGDVNGDGLDDLYACGAKGQAGALLLQQANGTFATSDTSVFTKNALCENVDAVFFDANGDGKPDLYVVSGGNEYEDGNQYLSDHLYINNGKGHFKESAAGLPSILTNKSCVAVADVNRNGHNDIFIGGLANARKYGTPQSSYLLLNDGKGNFKIADSSVIRLTAIGMVTAAGFADFNQDGWPDLVIAGEWMSIKIFMNDHGKFIEKEIPNSTGLWQSLYLSDVNADGYPDILAGNWGHNSKLWSGKNGPLKLYVKDFDRNGSLEQVMCYTINGQEYTFLAKDELERALPVLKKVYLTYDEVAGQTVQYMFYDLFKDYQELKAETLSNSCFINDRRGHFTAMDLPEDLQLAPVFAFQKTPPAPSAPGRFITGGNFFDVIPYEGRYDALSLGFFTTDGKNKLKVIDQPDLANIKGQIRDLKWVHTSARGDLLVVARNNDSLLFLAYKN